MGLCSTGNLCEKIKSYLWVGVSNPRGKRPFSVVLSFARHDAEVDDEIVKGKSRHWDLAKV